MIRGTTRTFALLGHPVAHSLSPAMHNAWFAHHGLDAVYVALPVAPSAARLAEAIHTLGLSGANITVPHKTRLGAALDLLGPVAAATGAVNTIVRRGDQLHGYNTDAEGFVRGWREAGGEPVGARAIVLGAGGAGRAVAAGLASHGADSVTLLNRSARPVDALAAAWPDTQFAVEPLDAWRHRSAEASLVVNALPSAGRPLVAALDLSSLATDVWWSDLNYWDDAPPGLAEASARGLRTATGHKMLLHQGALAFALFTGIEPDPAIARPLVLPAG